eukprot:TRINITY_DN20807_c0_g1_i1.p1 TRINITY_DN20807_c0_g1~~TRINITY_DN20807_c0_g1_i1.p1  ORF type:complete len:693 (+),score=256.26 TRINITY_DN20807_c0_g1_i1:82-2079(+)
MSGSAPAPTPAGLSSSQATATVTRKIKKVLDITLDDHMRTSLAAVSDFGSGAYGGDWERDRKNLRSMLEKRTLSLHSAFLQDFARVNDQFSRVTAEIDALCDSCARVKQGLQGTREESQQLVDHLAVLQQELEEARRKEHQVSAFLERFHLTPEDKAVLRGEVGPAFFQVLEKVKDIHSHCAELLSAQHQQAGIEIMEMTYMQQMNAYDRLYKWAQGLAAEVMANDTPEVPSLLVRALHTLRDRIALWNQLMQEVARQRRGAVARRFSAALTRGSAHARALELHAHDAQRYVGDMLAWVHQAVAEESELVDAFFSGGPSSRSGPEGGPASAQGDELSKEAVLDQIFEGLVKQLRQRVEQVLADASGQNPAPGGRHRGPPLVVFFRLESVLQFYSNTIPQTLGAEAALSVVLRDLKLQTLKRFFDLLQALSNQLLSAPLTLGTDLAPPAVLDDALKRLREMMETLATSLIPPEEREREFAAVLNGIIDPLMNLVDRVTGLERPAHCVLAINSVSHMIATLEQFDFTKTRRLKLSDRLKSDLNTLADHHSAHLLRRWQLADILAAARAGPAAGPLSQHPSCGQHALAETVAGFYQCIAAPGSTAMPLCEKLQSVRLREDVANRVARRVADAYAAIYAAVSAPRNQYRDPGALMRHPPDEVRRMLGVG